jgi:predicted O-methyltransferase YrrM
MGLANGNYKKQVFHGVRSAVGYPRRLKKGYRRLVRSAVLQRVGGPGLLDMLGPSGERLADPLAFVCHISPSADVDEPIEEFGNVQAEFERRRFTGTPSYKSSHDIEGVSMLLCYVLTRIIRPRIIVETGVANGASTFFFLSALARNGSGVLHSFDIRSNVGGYLTTEERGNWDLQILDRRRPLQDLARRLPSLSPIDLFLHDSHHRYRHMSKEFELAARSLRKDGVLLSDDVESTFAFHKFCTDRRLEPTYLFDRTKFFGGVVLAQ